MKKKARVKKEGTFVLDEHTAKIEKVSEEVKKIHYEMVVNKIKKYFQEIFEES